MANMREIELARIVESEVAAARVDSDTEKDRRDAFNAFHRKPYGDEKEHRSKVVAGDVQESILWMMPSLIRIFMSSDRVVEFTPTLEADEEEAKLQTDYVNYVIWKENDGYRQVWSWFFDTLLQKISPAKAWWSEEKKSTEAKYTGLDRLALAKVAADEGAEIIEESEPYQKMVPVETIGPDGVPIEVEQPIFVQDVTVRTTKVEKKCKIESFPAGELLISRDATSSCASDARCVGHERTLTYSELRQMGYSEETLDEIGEDSVGDDGSEQARKKTGMTEHSRKATTKAAKTYVVADLYVLLDFDQDGIEERRFIRRVNNKILENEPTDGVDIAILDALPLPHQVYSLAVADQTTDLQRIRTTLWRQQLDNLYQTNEPEIVVNEDDFDAYEEDWLKSAPGGRKRTTSKTPQSAFGVVAVPFTAGATFGMHDYLDKVRRDRTGVGSESQGADADVLANANTGVMAINEGKAAERIETVARNFAEGGFKDLMLIIHRIISQNQDAAKQVKLRGKWVEIDPNGWEERTEMTVDPALGSGNKSEKLLQLSTLAKEQKEMLGGEGRNVIVTPQNLYNTYAQMVELAGLRSVERYWQDPSSEEAQAEIERRQSAEDPNQVAIQQQIRILHEQNELAAQENAAKLAEADAKHQEQLLKLQADIEQAEDRHLEKMTELELKYQQNVPGSAV